MGADGAVAGGGVEFHDRHATWPAGLCLAVFGRGSDSVAPGPDSPVAKTAGAAHPDWGGPAKCERRASPSVPRGVDHWTIITDKGPELRRVTGISIRAGASETHLLYWLDGAEVSAALAVSQPQDKAGPLRPVTPDRPSKAVSARLMKDVLAALRPTARKDLKKKRPGREDIELVTMKTKDGARTLAFVHIQQDEVPPSYLSAAAVIGKDGAVKKWIGKPSSDLNMQEPKYLVDLDGTGEDSLVIDDSYYEGSYRSLLSFDASGEPKATQLTGDGA